MLALIIVTRLLWPDGAPLARYDFLVLAALAIQVAMLALRLETLAEAKVILIFHVVGTLMEIFKTSAGSWIYPEDEFVPHRRRAALLGLHVCGRRFLLRPHPAHLRRALLATIRRRRRRSMLCVADLRELLHASFPAGPRASSCSRRRLRCSGARWFTSASSASTTACRCCSGSCWWRCSSGSRKTSAHRRARGSTPVRRTLDAGLDLQARRLVSSDDHIVRAGSARSSSTAAGRDGRFRERPGRDPGEIDWGGDPDW